MFRQFVDPFGHIHQQLSVVIGPQITVAFRSSKASLPHRLWDRFRFEDHPVDRVVAFLKIAQDSLNLVSPLFEQFQL